MVGAGTGWDAELVADLGYDTIAFDISPTAIETANRIHPDSKAHYLTADLLDPPAAWHRAFDLVVEIYTVQALPIELQAAATKQVGEQVGPGGTLLVIAAARPDDEPDEAVEGPPWPLTRAGIEAFASDDLRLIQVVQSPSPVDPSIQRWRAEYLARLTVRHTRLDRADCAPGGAVADEEPNEFALGSGRADGC